MAELKELIQEKMGDVKSEIVSLQANLEKNKEKSDEAVAETKSLIEGLESRFEGLKSQLDNVEASTKRIGDASNGKKSFGEALYESLKENNDFEAYKKGNASSVSIDLKAAVDMTTSTVVQDGEVKPVQRVNGIFSDPDRTVHARDFIPTISTNQSAIRYVQEYSYEDGTAPQSAEGAALGKSSFKLVAKTAPVETVGATMTISKQMLDDSEGLSGYLQTRGLSKLALEEDRQVIYGSGTGGDLIGISGEATDFTSSFGKANPNKTDVLVQSIKQTSNDEYQANYIMVNNGDWFDMLLETDNEGRYRYTPQLMGNQPFVIAGVPIVPSTIINQDDFLTGDFNQGAAIWDRQTPTVEFSNSHGENFVKNMITARIQTRIAVTNYRPSAFVYGNFTAASSLLEANASGSV